MEELLGQHSGAHHGNPDLFERDIKLLRDYQLWIKIANIASDKLFAVTGYRNTYGKDWVPSHADILKSRLFWRIRSGRPPLPEAPPTSFSCSWYELIEVPGPHDCWDEIRIYDDKHAWLKAAPGVVNASVNQSLYEVLETHADGSWTLKYNCYKFKAWNAMIPTRSVIDNKVVDTERPGGWIEYIGKV